MTVPGNVPNCPPGLEYLSTLDQLWIEENLDFGHHHRDDHTNEHEHEHGHEHGQEHEHGHGHGHEQEHTNDIKYFIRNAMGQHVNHCVFLAFAKVLKTIKKTDFD